MPAYKKAPNAVKECVGPECEGCSSGNCYGHGGRVKRHSPPSSDEAGVHEPASKYGSGKSGGASVAGERLRMGDSAGAKHMHKQNLEDIQQMNTKKPELYAEGGAVDSWTKREDNERGVHRPFGSGHGSKAGHFVKSERDYSPEQDKGHSLESAKREHHKVLGEMKGMKKPNLYAEGGEVADGEPKMDEELKHAMGGEFMDALERKDRKGIMGALEAIVLSCRGKE